MSFKIQIRDAVAPDGKKIAIIPLSGRLDAAAASDLRQQFQQILGFGYSNLLLDLGAVTFMDSSGLGVMISILGKCRRLGGRLCFCRLPDSVKLVLNLTSQQAAFPSFESVEEAVAQFPTDALTIHPVDPR